MKKLILLSSLMALSCTPRQMASSNSANQEIKIAQNTNDSDYEATVLDVDFDKFLENKARPIADYTEEELKNLNLNLVKEWNRRYESTSNHEIFGSRIDYDPTVEYGKAVEYKLYQFFAFNAYKHDLKLPGL